MGFFSKKEESLVERTFNVKGMMCPHCEMNVKKSLLAVPGVKEANASHVLGKVSVTSAPDVTDEQICSTITAAGYTVRAE